MFWNELYHLSPDQLSLFYRFCTGSTREPNDGFSKLQGTRNSIQKFTIECPTNTSNKRLIEANTCSNKIWLPPYNSKERVREVIHTIIENDTNFFGRT